MSKDQETVRRSGLILGHTFEQVGKVGEERGKLVNLRADGFKAIQDEEVLMSFRRGDAKSPGGPRRC